MKRIILATTIAAGTFAGAASAEQYVCEMEQATGFAYSTIIRDQWTPTRFNDSPRFLLERNGDTATAKVFGDNEFAYECEPYTDSISNYWSCGFPDDPTIHLWFNVDLLRFTFTNVRGYSKGDADSGPISLGIGTCAELGG